MAVTKVRSSTQLNIDADLSIGHKLTSVTDPTNPQDAATKNYVDTNSLTASHFIFNEIPTGSINSANVTFTLANTPTANTVQVFLNGLLQQPGSGKDYTISSATITFVTAPTTGDILLAHYMK